MCERTVRLEACRDEGGIATQALRCWHGSHTAHRTGTRSHSQVDRGTTQDAHAWKWVLRM